MRREGEVEGERKRCKEGEQREESGNVGGRGKRWEEEGGHMRREEGR